MLATPGKIIWLLYSWNILGNIYTSSQRGWMSWKSTRNKIAPKPVPICITMGIFWSSVKRNTQNLQRLQTLDPAGISKALDFQGFPTFTSSPSPLPFLCPASSTGKCLQFSNLEGKFTKAEKWGEEVIGREEIICFLGKETKEKSSDSLEVRLANITWQIKTLSMQCPY